MQMNVLQVLIGVEKSLSGNEILIPEEFGEKFIHLRVQGGGTVTKELEISVFKTIQGVVVDGYLEMQRYF